MDMILLDWTRMGRSFCLAGAVVGDGKYQIVRPLLVKNRNGQERNSGWSPWLMGKHCRWEIFELIGAEPAQPQPPHVEDLWVKAMRPRNRSASLGQRQAILNETAAKVGEPVFGIPLTPTRSAMYLLPGTGRRSLATVTVPSQGISFTACHRKEMAGPDIKVNLHLPGPGDRLFPVKDHFLLDQAERGSPCLEEQIQRLNLVVRQMGEHIAVRLGLSRAFQPVADSEQGRCWLMADGFFSLTDPQA